MKEKVYVDRLFAEYEDTPEIIDFKEEIVANMKERVRSLVSGGLGEGAAFDKAAAELGDITAIADGAARKKRNETIGQMYMNEKIPLTKRTAAGLAAATALLLLGVGIALVRGFAAGGSAGSAAGGSAGSAVSMYLSAVLISLAIGLYIFFGLTQETAAHYAMKIGRACAYGAVGFIGSLGAGLAVVSFLFDGYEISFSLVVKIVLILPALCALIFLLATEPKRQKPWLKALIMRDIQDSMQFHQDMVDPVKAARFGVASGGLWILAIAVFLTLALYAGLPHAWIVFVFAAAVQVFMVAMIFSPTK